MTIRSYAQNFEDVLLWRALKHVVDGRYVDVGAAHPDSNSVTKLFYEAGWQGINIEPLPAMAEALRHARPRDVTLHAAVTSLDTETVDLTVVDQWDELSTTSADRAAELESQGRPLSTVTVPATRLDAVLAEHVPHGDVHFLKVDVEGAELDVLRTLDLQRNRPWIILAEVVAGGQESGSRTELRDHLAAAGYSFCYFDGLNDFFLAREREEALAPSFAVPVNVTDDFVALSQSDRVVVDVLAGKVGLPVPAQANEILQRVDALIHDRIEFESRLLALAESGADEQGWAEARRTIDRLTLTCASLEQTAFERERTIARYAAEVANHRAEAAAAAGHTAALRSAAEDSRQRLAEVLGSTSWRTTMPIRVARRPQAYLRKLFTR